MIANDYRKMNLTIQMNAIVAYNQYVIAGSNEGDILVINNSTFDIIHRLVRPHYQIQQFFIRQTSNGRSYEDDRFVEKDYLLVKYRNNCIELFELYD